MPDGVVLTLGLRERLARTAQAKRVPFSGGQTTWRRFGEGAPLVLLHGGHGSWLHWVRNIESLAGRYTVWVPDLPGYGDSDLPVGASLDNLVDGTIESIDRLMGGNTQVRLVGFSFGGLVAARLAQRRGGVVQLALFGPAGHGGGRRPRGELRAWRGLEPHSKAWDNVMRHNSISACSCSMCISKIAERSVGEGRHDCRTHTVPGAGHWVQYEAAQAINALLASWLE